MTFSTRACAKCQPAMHQKTVMPGSATVHMFTRSFRSLIFPGILSELHWKGTSFLKTRIQILVEYNMLNTCIMMLSELFSSVMSVEMAVLLLIKYIKCYRNHGWR